MLDQNNSSRFYILVGDQENWKISIEKKLWGFTETSKGSWNTIKSNEFVAFYVTTPIKKIIGFGRVTNKFIDESLIWNDEKRFKRSLWKYKISLEITYVCPSWENGIGLGPEFFLNTPRKVVSQEIFFDLVTKAEKKWAISIKHQICD